LAVPTVKEVKERVAPVWQCAGVLTLICCGWKLFQ
jgi:hypothetical protein